MAIDVDSKQVAIAEIIEGHIVDAHERVAVCIKGTVGGFPASLEAINCGWPFGVIYTIETALSLDSNSAKAAYEQTKITIYPRIGRGLMGFVTKLLLFESSGQPVGDKKLEKIFNFSYDDREVTERLIRYPGVADQLLFLENTAKFSEMVIGIGAGIYLAQPTSFNALDLDVCRATFNTLAQLGQVLFEAF